MTGDGPSQRLPAGLGGAGRVTLAYMRASSAGEDLTAQGPRMTREWLIQGDADAEDGAKPAPAPYPLETPVPFLCPPGPATCHLDWIQPGSQGYLLLPARDGSGQR